MPDDHHRHVELDRLLSMASTEDRLVNSFRGSLERDSGEAAGNEGQVIEGGPGPRPEDAKPANR